LKWCTAPKGQCEQKLHDADECNAHVIDMNGVNEHGVHEEAIKIVETRNDIYKDTVEEVKNDVRNEENKDDIDDENEDGTKVEDKNVMASRFIELIWDKEDIDRYMVSSHDKNLEVFGVWWHARPQTYMGEFCQCDEMYYRQLCIG